MKSKNYSSIVASVRQVVKDGAAESLLQKIEFDYEIKTAEEFANYVVILQVLLETSIYSTHISHLLVRKILGEGLGSNIFVGTEKTFDVIKENAVFPFTRIASTAQQLISTVLYHSDNAGEVNSFPPIEYLRKFNRDLLFKYISDAEKIAIPELLTLLYTCIETIDYSQDSRIYLQKEAISRVKMCLIKDSELFKEYLHHFLRFKYSGTSRHHEIGLAISPEPFFEQIFGSLEDFEEWISIFKKKSDSSQKNMIYDEVKLFLQAYKNNKLISYNGQIKLTESLHYLIKKDLETENSNQRFSK